MDGASRCSGRVEIYHNQQWGTICDDGWDLNDAQVVCRELDCGTATKALPGSRYGSGPDTVWLDQVNCTGKEAFLNECPKKPWGDAQCDPRRKASVECSGNAMEQRLKLFAWPRSLDWLLNFFLLDTRPAKTIFSLNRSTLLEKVDHRLGRKKADPVGAGSVPFQRRGANVHLPSTYGSLLPTSSNAS